MPVFVIVATKDPAPLARALEKHAAGKVLQLRNDAWLVSHPLTTKEFAERIGLRELGAPGVVFAIANYSGRASPDVWEFLKTHME